MHHTLHIRTQCQGHAHQSQLCTPCSPESRTLAATLKFYAPEKLWKPHPIPQRLSSVKFLSHEKWGKKSSDRYMCMQLNSKFDKIQWRTEAALGEPLSRLACAFSAKHCVHGAFAGKSFVETEVLQAAEGEPVLGTCCSQVSWSREVQDISR